MRGIADLIRYARRLALKSAFRGRREYVHVGCGKNIPVFHAPRKRFYERAGAWLAGGMVAVMVLSTGANCFAASPAQTQTQAQAQGGFTLGQLMASLARRRHGQVSYEETDYFAVLDRPLKSSGVLIYDAPGHLEKRTLEPKKQALILDGDQLTVQRGRRSYRMQLSAYPQVAPLVDAMRDTLAGNEAALEKAFKIGFTGTADGWKLELVPLDKDVAHKVSRVEIAGAHDEIRSVEILQVGGDRSVMTLGEPANAANGANMADAMGGACGEWRGG